MLWAELGSTAVCWRRLPSSWLPTSKVQGSAFPCHTPWSPSRCQPTLPRGTSSREDGCLLAEQSRPSTTPPAAWGLTVTSELSSRSTAAPSGPTRQPSWTASPGGASGWLGGMGVPETAAVLPQERWKEPWKAMDRLGRAKVHGIYPAVRDKDRSLEKPDTFHPPPKTLYSRRPPHVRPVYCTAQRSGIGLWPPPNRSPSRSSSLSSPPPLPPRGATSAPPALLAPAPPASSSPSRTSRNSSNRMPCSEQRGVDGLLRRYAGSEEKGA